MDFFDDLTFAIRRDGAQRGVRCSAGEWQRFMSSVAPEPDAAPVVQTVAVNIPDDRDSGYSAPAPEVPAADMAGEAEVQATAGSMAFPADWNNLRNMALNCRSCPLCGTRQNVVFGEGNENARLMFIGEGPGADEDASGRPFVGAAGQLLDKMIAAMHLARADVYIANVVKCRPPGNRMPGEEEAAACIGYLHRQIELIKPEVIVLLGGTALHFLLKTDGITKHRGRWLDFNNIAVMPTFHPAYLLRNPGAKREAWHDLKLVMAKLGIPV